MLSTWAGYVFGAWVSPLVAVVTLVRRRRVFHARGATWRGEVVAVGTGPAARCAGRLAGNFTVRFSGGKFSEVRDDLRDILGCTVRFVREGAVDQDLIFASFRTLSELGAGLKSTDTRDLLRNTYYTASWSRDPDLGVVTWRLVPSPSDGGEGADAFARFDSSLASGVALTVAASTDGETWIDVVELRVSARADSDDATTSFSPWNAGRGIVPVGFVNGLRRVVYAVGRTVRGAS